jgi:COP9 signalosome complex subunit 4
MDELERRLRAVNEAPAKDRQALFNQIILKEVEKAYSSASIEALKILIHYGLSETLGLLTSRQIYSDFNQAFTQKNFPPEACINVFQYALGLLEQRTVAFEEQITLTRTALANIYEEQQEWLLAAKALSLIPLDSGTRQIAKEYKLSVFIRILRLYLEDEDYVSADQYINRAQMLDPQDKLSILQLLAAQAKSLDLKRQFLNSAVKYYELSICRDIHEDEQLEALRSSCICAILSGAGPQRSKILNTLYKDSRVSENELTLKDNVGFIVTRMHLGWVCRY